VELGAGRARYFELYGLAPVGYCTIGEKGRILEIDPTAATLLGWPRNPLAPIRTGAYILSNRHNQDSDAKPILDLISRQATPMARLVDDLLDCSRIERGKVELRKERVDLGQVVTQALEACKPQLEANGHHLTLMLPGEVPVPEADPVRLEQMLSSLVSNACKFSPMGGEIHVSAALEGPEVVVRVRDNGMGMTPDAVAHVFDLFYQADLGRAQPHSGLGIGLTLVQQLAELHGGSAVAHSESPGMGSEFLIRLPAFESGQKEIQPVPFVGATAPDRPKHVLISPSSTSACRDSAGWKSPPGFLRNWGTPSISLRSPASAGTSTSPELWPWGSTNT
jgi:two-component sensor histidine kinase